MRWEWTPSYKPNRSRLYCAQFHLGLALSIIGNCQKNKVFPKQKLPSISLTDQGLFCAQFNLGLAFSILGNCHKNKPFPAETCILRIPNGCQNTTFQARMISNRQFPRYLLGRVQAAGCRAFNALQRCTVRSKKIIYIERCTSQAAECSAAGCLVTVRDWSFAQ